MAFDFDKYPDPLDCLQYEDLTQGLQHIWDMLGREAVVELIREAYGVLVSIPRVHRIERLMIRYIAEHYNPSKEEELCVFLEISPWTLGRYLKRIAEIDLTEYGYGSGTEKRSAEGTR